MFGELDKKPHMLLVSPWLANALPSDFFPTLNQLITFCNPTSNFSSSFWKPSPNPNTSFRISTHLSTSSYACYAFYKSLLCERNLLIPLNPSQSPPLLPRFWEVGEPNNHIDEDCGYIVKTEVLSRVAIRSWYDAPCTMGCRYICELERRDGAKSTATTSPH